MGSEQPAPLLYIVNLGPGGGELERITVQGNPPKLSGEVKVAYNRFKVPGMSHQPMMYSNTENHKTPPIEFEFFGDTKDDRNKIDDTFQLWQSWLVAPDASDLKSAAPPRLLFVWPQVAQLLVVITDWKYELKEFNANGDPTWYLITCSFEEINDKRLLPDLIKSFGIQRGSVTKSL